MFVEVKSLSNLDIVSSSSESWHFCGSATPMRHILFLAVLHFVFYPGKGEVGMVSNMVGSGCWQCSVLRIKAEQMRGR